MNQKTITITSDFGNRDFYAAAVTGRLITLAPEANIVSVTHLISTYNIYEASFIVRNAWTSFPEKTVHLILVSGNTNQKIRHVALLYKNHFFVGPDSGVFGLIFEEKPEKIVVIEPTENATETFPELDVCAVAAAHLANGNDLAQLGPATDHLLETIPFRPTSENNIIKGMVIYIDNYRNVITNISKKMFDKMNKNNKYTIRFGKYYTEKISPSYDYAPEGELVAVFGSTGLLEIALYKSPAQDLLGIRVNDIVRIEFD